MRATDTIPHVLVGSGNDETLTAAAGATKAVIEPMSEPVTESAIEPASGFVPFPQAGDIVHGRLQPYRRSQSLSFSGAASADNLLQFKALQRCAARRAKRRR